MNEPLQKSSTLPRELTEEEKQKLQNDTQLVSDFKCQKLEKEALKNWDLFYKRNTTNFYKDRHWTKREFQELGGKREGVDKLVVFETGCGVGNFMFPLLQEDNSLYFYACDFSPRAVQFVKENEAYDSTRCTAFQADLTSDNLCENVPSEGVDIATMIFVLSAIHPDKMCDALKNVHKVVRPGGCVLVRDYGLHDHAMLRFSPGHKLAENLYVRQDGTRAYYFSLEVLSEKFEAAGFTCETREYIMRETVNKKEGVCVPRVFVQAKFIKNPTEKESPAHKKSCTRPQKAEIVEAEPTFHIHTFSQKMADAVVHYQVWSMADSFVLWAGSCADMGSLAMSMVSPYSTTPIGSLLCGDQSEPSSVALAQKLAKKTGKQVFVSLNVKTDLMTLPLVEQRIFEELKIMPEKF